MFESPPSYEYVKMEMGECLVRLDWQTYDENTVRDELQLRHAVLAALTGYAGVGTYDELHSLTDYELSLPFRLLSKKKVS